MHRSSLRGCSSLCCTNQAEMYCPQNTLRRVWHPCHTHATSQGVHLSPLGFAACQSKKCTNQARTAPTKLPPSQLFGGTPAQIEYAAEMGLEHHLGLTCDPVCGLVQIPCIERNAFAAARALDANTFSNFSDGKHRVSFDQVVEVMRQTGNDLPSLYKETSEGGLAKNMEQK